MAEAVQESLLISPAAASKLTGIGVSTIRAAIAAGKIDARLVGSHTKAFRESVLAWVKEGLPKYSKADYSRRRRGSKVRPHR